MQRRKFLKTGGLILSTLFTIKKGAAKLNSKKPNILFILTDDQDFSTIGCYGGKVHTPYMDSLAKDGMKFTRAYAVHTVCAPSRYAILTGRYATRCEHIDFLRVFPKGTIGRPDNTRVSLEENHNNLPGVLSANGYKTGMVGKWHLGEHLSGRFGGPDWKKFGLIEYDMDADPKDPKVAKALKHNQKRLQQEIKKRGFDYAAGIYWANLKEVRSNPLNFHNIDWTVKSALDFIEQNKDEPFFLYFSTTLHHGPHPKQSIDGKELITGEGVLDKPLNVLPSRKSIYQRVKKAGCEKDTAYCTWLDDGVGALLNKLDELKLSDNTLVIFLSDHGIDLKSSLYEGGTHVPCMIRWPGKIKAGVVNDELVQSIDFAATIFDIAGITPPKELPLDGMSLQPLFPGKNVEWRDSLYFEMGWARAVMTKDWKYIAVRYPDDVIDRIAKAKEPQKTRLKGYIENHGLCRRGMKNKNYMSPDQLFNLKKDPDEQKNLVELPEYKSQFKKLQQKMIDYLKKIPHRPFGELRKND